MAQSAAAVQAFNLAKRFGHTTAVTSLTFTREWGELTGLFGPNGSGKTTSLRLLFGLVRPDAGTSLVDGTPFAGLPSPARAVGVVVETTGFHPRRTARSHLRVLAAPAALNTLF